jgi:tRNA A-37 threonylcarbamoyl transferase component Bud32
LGIPLLLTADAIRSAGRQLTAPFQMHVVCDGRSTEICCTEILRLVPQRRIVCATQWDGTPAIAKIFLQRWGAARNARRELSGLRAIHDAGIPGPNVLAIGTCAGSREPILLLERITQAVELRTLLEQATQPQIRVQTLARAVEFIARQHEAGLVQEDLHPGNMLWCRGKWHAIDGSTVRVTRGRRPVAESAGLHNLGMFLAQLRPADNDLLEELCAIYFRTCGRAASNEDIDRVRRSREACRARRIKICLRKSTRDCTEFMRFTEGPLTIVCHRCDDSPDLRRILRAPDEAIAAGICLKNGNSATAARVDLEDRSLVIKRYNLRRGGLLRTLRFLLGPSRAWRSWRTGQYLRAMEIATPRPVAVMERRYGPIRTAGYFVTEYVSGRRGQELFASKELTDAEASRLADATMSLVRRLYDVKLAHGDLNSRNFIYRDSEPLLIDLDASRQYRSGVLRRWAHLRDCCRLLRNFTAPTIVYRELRARMARHLHEIGAISSVQKLPVAPEAGGAPLTLPASAIARPDDRQKSAA